MRTRKMARMESSSNPIETMEPEVYAQDVQDEEQTTTSQALQNPLVVHEIIQYLNLQDLKSCRVINKLWRSLSSSVIFKRDCSVVKLKYDAKNKCFQQQQREELSQGSDNVQKVEEIKKPRNQLRELNKLLQKTSSQSFPCTNFVFHGGNLGDAEAQTFFKLHGVNIKSLEVTNISFYCQGTRRRRKSEGKRDPSCFTTKSVFRKICQNYLPNLNMLSIKDFDFNWSEREKLVLPKLETFLWENCKRTVWKILKGTPNLKSIKKTLTYDDIVIITKTENRAARHAAMFYVLNYK